MNILQVHEEVPSPADAVSDLIDLDASILAVNADAEEATASEGENSDIQLSNFLFGDQEDFDEAAPEELDMDDGLDLFEADTEEAGDTTNGSSPLLGLDAFLGTTNKERNEE